MKSYLVALVVGVVTVVAIPIGIFAQRGGTADTPAQRSEKTQAAQVLAGRIGQILGAATACRDVARPRISGMTEMLMEAFKISTSNDDELNTVKQLYEKNVAEGQSAVKSRKIDCATADRNLADLEQVTRTPLAAAPPAASSTPAAAKPVTPPQAAAAPLPPRTTAFADTPAPVTVAPATAPRAAAAPLPPAPAGPAPTPRLAAVGVPPAPVAGGPTPPRATAVAIPSVPAPLPPSPLQQ